MRALETTTLIGVFVSTLACSDTDAGPPARRGAWMDEPAPTTALERRLRSIATEHAAHLEADGSAAFGQVGDGDFVDTSFVARSDRCYRAVVVADGVAELSVEVHDRDSVPLRVAEGMDAVVVGAPDYVCVAEPSPLRLRVRSRRGAGKYVLRLFHSGGPAAPNPKAQ